MEPASRQILEPFDPRFKIFHELMRWKVREVLLVSTPYDAWIMEDDCRLSEATVNEYRVLNLSHPPRLHWVSSAKESLRRLNEKNSIGLITENATHTPVCQKQNTFQFTTQFVRKNFPRHFTQNYIKSLRVFKKRLTSR